MVNHQAKAVRFLLDYVPAANAISFYELLELEIDDLTDRELVVAARNLAKKGFLEIIEFNTGLIKYTLTPQGLDYWHKIR